MLLEKIGGEDAFEQLLQTAWIVTSQDFRSDKKVETEEFVSELLENLKNMIKKMEESPKMYSIFNQESSYLDSELTKSLPNYEENNYILSILKNIILDNKKIIINLLPLSIIVTLFTCIYSYYFNYLLFII